MLNQNTMAPFSELSVLYPLTLVTKLSPPRISLRSFGWQYFVETFKILFPSVLLTLFKTVSAGSAFGCQFEFVRDLSFLILVGFSAPKYACSFHPILGRWCCNWDALSFSPSYVWDYLRCCIWRDCLVLIGEIYSNAGMICVKLQGIDSILHNSPCCHIGWEKLLE